MSPANHALDVPLTGHEAIGPVVDVRVINSEEIRAAPYRSTQNFGTVNAADLIAIQEILPQAEKRDRAVISSSPNSTPEYVLIGRREEVMNGKGAKLWNGQSITIESAPAMWIAPGTTPPTHIIDVSVIDERYA